MGRFLTGMCVCKLSTNLTLSLLGQLGGRERHRCEKGAGKINSVIWAGEINATMQQKELNIVVWMEVINKNTCAFVMHGEPTGPNRT